MKKRILLAGLLVVTLTGAASADGLYAVRPIPGYACSKLAASDLAAMDTHGGVPIRTAPSPSAPVGAMAASVLLTKRPLHVINGFVEVLRFSGEAGWIEQSRVAPFDPMARCIPSIMSNGRPGIG